MGGQRESFGTSGTAVLLHSAAAASLTLLSQFHVLFKLNNAQQPVQGVARAAPSARRGLFSEAHSSMPALPSSSVSSRVLPTMASQQRSAMSPVSYVSSSPPPHIPAAASSSSVLSALPAAVPSGVAHAQSLPAPNLASLVAGSMGLASIVPPQQAGRRVLPGATAAVSQLPAPPGPGTPRALAPGPGTPRASLPGTPRDANAAPILKKPRRPKTAYAVWRGTVVRKFKEMYAGQEPAVVRPSFACVLLFRTACPNV